MTAERNPTQLTLDLRSGEDATIIVLKSGQGRIVPREHGPRLREKRIIANKTLVQSIQSYISSGEEDADMTDLIASLRSVDIADRDTDFFEEEIDETFLELRQDLEGSKMGSEARFTEDIRQFLKNLAEEIWTEPNTT